MPRNTHPERVKRRRDREKHLRKYYAKQARKAAREVKLHAQ